MSCSARTATMLACLVVVASPNWAAAAPATPAAPAAPAATIWSVIDAPPAPDSSFAHQLAHHRSEQHRPGFAADGSDHPMTPVQAPNSFVAANFSSLTQTDWALDHQEITVSVDPFTATLSGEVTATVSFHKDGLKDIFFRLGVLDGVDVRNLAGESVTF